MTTEQQIIEELKKRFPEPQYCDWKVWRRMNEHSERLVTACARFNTKGDFETWLTIAIAPYDDLPELLRRIRSLPLPETLRCLITGNPCGTDTHAAGFGCECGPCQRWKSKAEPAPAAPAEDGVIGETVLRSLYRGAQDDARFYEAKWREAATEIAALRDRVKELEGQLAEAQRSAVAES